MFHHEPNLVGSPPRDQVEAFLLEREEEFSLMLGWLAAGADASLAVVGLGGSLQGLVILKDGHLGLAGEFPQERLAEMVQHVRPWIYDTVIGSSSLVGQWVAADAGPFQKATDQWIYRLDQLRPPQVPGSLRPCRVGDRELLTDWILAFHQEALPHEEYPRSSARRAALQRTQEPIRTYFWQDTGGQTVAMAGLARPTPRGVTVNLVYTPPERRGQGYAAAVVGAISQLALQGGKSFCVLYADQANPASNRVYQKLGYEVVADSVIYLRGKPS